MNKKQTGTGTYKQYDAPVCEKFDVIVEKNFLASIEKSEEEDWGDFE